MRYELWGLRPGNLIDTFATEAEALEAVGELLDAGWSPEDLSLGRVSNGKGELIAEGAELAARTLTADPQRTRRLA